MRFWLSWEERANDYRPMSDPPNDAVLGWWCSGEAGDGSFHTLCALVEAASLEAAQTAVRLDWPAVEVYRGEERPCARVWRFGHEVAADWLPSDRFPLKDWELKRVRR